MSDSGDTGVRIAGAPEERKDAFGVRRAVFVREQGISEDLEYDGREDESTHFVAYDGGRPVGAARLRAVAGDADGSDETDVSGDEEDDGSGGDAERDADAAKVERVAVLADARGEGWGARLMDAAESAARERGLGRVELHAQTRVAGFYERLGYERVGGEFEEAGIPHVKMVKSLEP